MAKKNESKRTKENLEKKQGKPKVNPDLEGFDIKIDSFGEISSTYNIDKINEFLNRQVDDKKLRDREDLNQFKKGADQKKQKNNDEEEE